MLYHCDSLGDINKLVAMIEEGEEKEDKERDQLL
jgi:hypothetical protein